MLRGSPDRLWEAIPRAIDKYTSEVLDDPKNAARLNEITEYPVAGPFAAGIILEIMVRPLLDKIFRPK